MDASIEGVLANPSTWRLFTHKGVDMNKHDVQRVLIYGQRKGYTLVSEITDEEIDAILNHLPHDTTNNTSI